MLLIPTYYWRFFCMWLVFHLEIHDLNYYEIYANVATNVF